MITRLLLITYSDETTIFRFSLIEECTKKAMLSTSLSLYLYKENNSIKGTRQTFWPKMMSRVQLTEFSIFESEIDTYTFLWKFLSINFHLFQIIQLDDFDSPENQSCCVLRASLHVVTWKLPNSITKFTKKADTEVFLFYILQLEKSFYKLFIRFHIGKDDWKKVEIRIISFRHKENTFILTISPQTWK